MAATLSAQLPGDLCSNSLSELPTLHQQVMPHRIPMQGCAKCWGAPGRYYIAGVPVDMWPRN